MVTNMVKYKICNNGFYALFIKLRFWVLGMIIVFAKQRPAFQNSYNIFVNSFYY